jgi:hypothetical protein
MDNHGSLMKRFKKILLSLAIVLVGFTSCSYLVSAYVVGPKPIFKLSEGPDTDFSKSCFKYHFPEINLDSVSNIYCQRYDWQERLHKLRFTAKNKPTILKILDRYTLDENPQWHQSLGQGEASWWQEKALITDLEKYSHKDNLDYSTREIWMDHKTGWVWYYYWLN